MAITNYQQADFINITELTAVFQNAGPNLGTPPNATYAGLVAASYGPENIQVKNGDPCSAQVIYSYDLDHSTPTNPIPANAQITKITAQMQISTNEVTSFMDGTFTTDHGNTGRAIASAVANIDIRPLSVFNTPPPDVNSWITSPATPYLFGVISDTDTTAYGASASATGQGNLPVLAQLIFDIAALPAEFPLGYMDYATFVAQFTNWFTSFNHQASSSVNWLGVINGVDSVSGAWSNGIDFAASNLTIIVEWTVPVVTNWNIDSFDPENNILTLTRPDPGVTVEEDTELPESIFIDDEEYTPEDFYIIIWTRITIILRLKPRRLPPLPEVEMIFAGTTFSGRVSLGTFSITQVDLSGVYELDPDAHDDTLYIRSGTTVTEEARMIPSPFLLTYFVDNKEADILHYNGVRMRVTGVGDLQGIFQSYSAINTDTLVADTLRTVNNVSPFRLANFIDQNCALRVYTSNTGDYMNVSQIIIFWKKLYTGYPQ